MTALPNLKVEGLGISLRSDGVELVTEASFEVQAGQIMGIVGESGSGKTILSLALIGLLPAALKAHKGVITLGQHQVRLSDDVAHPDIARSLAMIFQQPQSALNPTMKVGRQLTRVLMARQGTTRRDSVKESLALLTRVGIREPERTSKMYPHQLSGGMCQRVLIAMALVCRPAVLIADEPTTALDVTVQAQIFDLIEELVAETKCGVIFISHDIAAVSEICDDIVVMFGGQTIEFGRKSEVLSSALHPYTRNLLRSREVFEESTTSETIDFDLPGCRYANRCAEVHDACSHLPDWVSVGETRGVACHLYSKGESVAPR